MAGLIPLPEVGTLSVIAITLRYVFALSYNVLPLWRNVIAFIRYRFKHIVAFIASHRYRSKLINQRYCFYWLPLFSNIFHRICS